MRFGRIKLVFALVVWTVGGSVAQDVIQMEGEREEGRVNPTLDIGKEDSFEDAFEDAFDVGDDVSMEEPASFASGERDEAENATIEDNLKQDEEMNKNKKSKRPIKVDIDDITTPGSLVSQ